MRTVWDRVWPLGGQPLSAPTYEVGRKGGLSKAGFESSKPRRLRAFVHCRGMRDCG